MQYEKINLLLLLQETNGETAIWVSTTLLLAAGFFKYFDKLVDMAWKVWDKITTSKEDKENKELEQLKQKILEQIETIAARDLTISEIMERADKSLENHRKTAEELRILRRMCEAYGNVIISLGIDNLTLNEIAEALKKEKSINVTPA